ncbi:von Willebrand factor A domain-containing protein 7-like isoform X2 [Haliotis rufescens]|uniref:von Willebrand factor A domain-containing protein 7-like isoform X2 n=1 Tax=Haliotis rufescens TaxID=6454 RepID=UPI00201EE8E2|nr:von Willebrand factor A domain-containing protein 7-like isoform X2 [Haliotis rufescens]
MTHPLFLPLICIYLKLVNGFFPNHLSSLDLGKETFTHQDITEVGILRAVAAYFEENPRPESPVGKGELTGLAHITARKLFDRYYGEDASEKRFKEAIDTITSANNLVDENYLNIAKWHCQGETIRAANEQMIQLREQIIQLFEEDNPNLDYAMELCGQFLHIMQMFYSNSNWVELSGAVPYYSLGLRGRPLYGQAPPPMDTCRSCGQYGDGDCKDNLIIKGSLLTSGYRSGQDVQKPFKDPKLSQIGKCSHGGSFDDSASTSAAIGGINKDATSPSLSPHYHLHRAAVATAINHTAFFFEDKEYGLRHVLGNSNYEQLLQLKSGKSIALVLDYSGSMSDEIEAVKTKIGEIINTVSGTINEPSNYIISLFNDPLSLNKVVQFASGNETLTYLQTVAVNGGDDCPEYAMDGLLKALTLCQPDSELYAFTDASAKDPEKTTIVRTLALEKRVKIDFLLTGDCSSRKKRSYQGIRKLDTPRSKRSTDGLDLFRSLAASTGGSVYVTNKRGISSVADMIKESVSASSVTVLKMSMEWNRSLNITFPVDSSVRQLTIKILTVGDTPSEKIYSPDGSNFTSNMTIKDLGNGIKLIKLKTPMQGLWSVARLGSNDWEIEISARSILDASVKFVQRNEITGFDYELTGRPIAGDTVTLIATLPSMNLLTTLNSLLLLNSDGLELTRHDGFERVKGREESAMFRKEFVLPGQSFRIGLIGTDNHGHQFQRFHSKQIVPVHIKLKFLPINGTLYINERLAVPFEVTNKGDAESSIDVNFKDDQGFAETPVTQTFDIGPGDSASGTFWLQAGSQEGVTTTVTVSARASSSDSGRFQYIIRRLSTSKRVVRKVDTTNPVCNITSIAGTCDLTVIDSCTCNTNRWSASAELWDEGFGLYQATSSISEDDGTFSLQNFNMSHTLEEGVITARVSSSCCNALAYINVVDMAGNSDTCLINRLTDGGVPVTNSSVTERAYIKRQCVVDTGNDKKPEKKQSRNQGGLHVGIVVGTVVGVTALIIVIVSLVVVKKRKQYSSNITARTPEMGVTHCTHVGNRT